MDKMQRKYKEEIRMLRAEIKMVRQEKDDKGLMSSNIEKKGTNKKSSGE